MRKNNVLLILRASPNAGTRRGSTRTRHLRCPPSPSPQRRGHRLRGRGGPRLPATRAFSFRVVTARHRLRSASMAPRTARPMISEHAASTSRQAKDYGAGAFSDEHLKELRAQGLTIPVNREGARPEPRRNLQARRGALRSCSPLRVQQQLLERRVRAYAQPVKQGFRGDNSAGV